MKQMSEHLKEIHNPKKNIFLEAPPLPEKLQLELNETCNHTCVFCPFHSSYLVKKINYGVMDVSFAKKVLKQASEIGIGRKELGLFATGEPLLYKQLPEIVRYAKDVGFPYVYITTNGSLASIDKMKTLIESGIDSIRFSINAGISETYKIIHGRDDFDVVINNIIELSKYIALSNRRINLSVSFVKTKKTKKEFVLLRKKLYPYIDDIVTFDVNSLQEINDVLESEYGFDNETVIKENAVCPVVFNTLYIDSRRNVDLCCASYKSKLPVGKLGDEFDLEKEWREGGLRVYRRKMLDGQLEGTVCEKCYLRTIILGD